MKADVSDPVEIVVGDVVQLNSGGPAMTVEGLGGGPDNAGASCVWFDEGGVPCCHHFISTEIFKKADTEKAKAKPDIHS